LVKSFVKGSLFAVNEIVSLAKGGVNPS
jgi:hypothetical protein